VAVPALRGAQSVPGRFETVAIGRGDVIATVTATGRLQGLNTVEVGAEVSGKVVQVRVTYNDVVKKGQVLAEIDPEQLRAAVEEAQAQLAVASANILQNEASAAEARQNLERAQQQASKGLVSQRDLEAAQAAAARTAAALESARASATLARATLNAARSRLQKTTIVAPMDGVVLSRSVEPGQTVNAGFQTPVLFKLAGDLTRMELYVDIDEADIGRVATGQGATFTVDAYPDRQFPSVLKELRNAPKITSNVVTYEAVLAVTNEDGALRPGMTATATIATARVKDALVIANAALRYTPPRGFGPFQHESKTAEAPIPAGRQRAWLPAEPEPKPVVIRTGVTDGVITELLGTELPLGTEVIVNARVAE
jgi:HlyD family secretion protein